MEEALSRLEGALGRSLWLSGVAFGLADVSWAVNLHRLTQARYPLADQARLRAWYERILERPAFRRAVLEWHPGVEA